ncbi:MAG: hypothetical protein M3Y44_14950 [Actinomycetota bacterium]|nr:hypothetical protein [Actinomycetota bacterium]
MHEEQAVGALLNDPRVGSDGPGGCLYPHDRSLDRHLLLAARSPAAAAPNNCREPSAATWR